MPPSAEQITNIKNILQLYKTQVRIIVARHKTSLKKSLRDMERRKAQMAKT